jgi:hypothetical protein
MYRFDTFIASSILACLGVAIVFTAQAYAADCDIAILNGR